MGFYKSTYHFYGVHVPKDRWVKAWAAAEGDRADKVIKNLGLNGPDCSVGHVSAGAYDRDMFFLAVGPRDRSVTVDLGEFRSVPVGGYDVDAERWNDVLRTLAEALGYGELDTPGWITVPDES